MLKLPFAFLTMSTFSYFNDLEFTFFTKKEKNYVPKEEKDFVTYPIKEYPLALGICFSFRIICSSYLMVFIKDYFLYNYFDNLW